jgi:hypothetical protein
MFQWLGLGAVNTALLWGTLLIASPIIIHLLSKRRFRILDWAAMEFLLDAERRNRRRIRLEHLILLLLRSLAVILIALLVARPYLLPGSFAARAVEAARFEHVVLLDDSASMEARLGSKTVFDEAKRLLTDLARQTAAERSGDSLTLILTSQPGRPILNGQLLAPDRVEGTVALIEGLAVSDRSAALDAALLALDDMLARSEDSLNRLVTVLTDLRRRDWLDDRAEGPEAEEAGGVAAVLRRVSEKAQGVTVADVGGGWEANLSVADIAVREKALVAGVPARFEVVVANHGDREARDVPVTFTAGESLPLRASIDAIEPGGQAAASFTFTFGQPGSAPVRAEIAADVLRRDNVRHYAASARPGVPVLLVDGEPALDYGEGETFYLERALSPPGDLPSGNAVEVVSENQFEGTPLDRYPVVILANLYHLTESRRTSLEQWVRRGGGLVFFLGDQVDELFYNEELHAKGTGLFPLRLSAVRGDETGGSWAHLSESSANHPVLRVFEGARNPFLRRVKIFRWWQGAPNREAERGGSVRVIATLDDPDASPVMVEQTLGKGRVIVVTTTADAEWTTWPGDPSYLVTMLELARYAMRPEADTGSVGVAVPIRTTLDPSRYASTVRVEPPGSAEPVEMQALPDEDGKSLVLHYEDTARQGDYRLHFLLRDGSEQTEHVAVNLDPTEGDLKPAGRNEVSRLLGDANIEVVAGRSFLSYGTSGARTEIWRAVLVALVAALCIEQALAWWFGTRRA